MILPKDINPVNTLYFNGALVIKSLEQTNSEDIDFFELYKKLRESNQLSFQSYIFAIDWLYLLGSVKINNKGLLEKCF